MELNFKQLGIISGNGGLPILIAKRAQEKNIEVYGIAFINETDKIINKYIPHINWVQLGKLLPIIEYFKSNGVNNVVTAGLLKHNRIFDTTKFDDSMMSVITQIKDKKADSILGSIANEFIKYNLNVIPMKDLLIDDIAGDGILCGPDLTQIQYNNIDFGIKISKELSKLDIGQTIVIKDRAIVAVESMEGTDNCILRAGKIAGSDCIVIKTAKFNQDLRFDLPVIGTTTVNMIKKIKSKILVVESGKTIILDKEEVYKKANMYGITILGISK